MKPRSCSIRGSTLAARHSIWQRARDISNCAAACLVAIAWTCRGVHDPWTYVIDVCVPCFSKYMDNSLKFTDTTCSCFEAVQLSVSLNGKLESNNLLLRLPVKSPRDTAATTNLKHYLFKLDYNFDISVYIRVVQPRK